MKLLQNLQGNIDLSFSSVHQQKIRPELDEILTAEAAMPGLAALEAEAAENTERIRIRITDEIEFEG